ncbi:Sieve element occlusion, N-terminal [Sesbania bispinosa]|nr:Sieve element occlusion, N-terminal [Sesbania bispinosa]
MSLTSNAASGGNASLIQQTSATSPQHKVYLPNPFELDDPKILDRVYLTHLNDDETCDIKTLFDLVSSVVLQSLSQIPTTSFKPEFPTLKLISCQMITTPRGEHYVHQTTMCILQHLKTYSWEAKALVTLAAFALEYGNLLYLTDTTTSDPLVNSLKQLNQIQNRKAPATNLVLLVMEVLQHIQEWATWSSVGYDTVEVPSLSDALQEIPVVVYWTIASIVAATGNLVGVSDYNLSAYTDRLSLDIEVFKEKHVLLFISSLNRVQDEIRLLNSIHDRLKENPKEVIKGYKKEDFTILWIPVVVLWDDEQKNKFNTLKNIIKWYAVECFSELPGIGLIREKLNYWGKPIVPVLNPLGDIMNEDAMDLIFQWGIDAFPFRKSDGDDLTLKWKWFWDVTKKLNLGIQVKGDRYIFIYGGADKKWVQDFTLAVERTKRHETILRADAIIEHYHLGKDDPKIVPRFWIEIESKRLKKHKDGLDCEIQDIVKSLLCLKQDPQGWVILAKGCNIKLLGHGEPMYQTLAEFEIWKDRVLQKEGFDIAFKEYYETKLKEMYARQPCAYVNVDNNNANVLATITCPNATCGRMMEVTSVNYKCCHRDAADTTENVMPPSGYN